ncbi:dTMP kinase [Streptomyces olivochromogenes]|uniref:dTMP kinase n=1 Tax=Streptomyces olivochromogenes TaxID=1963 RepID=UPI0036DDAC00
MTVDLTGPDVAGLPPWAPAPDVLAGDPHDITRAPRIPFSRLDHPGKLIVFDGVDGSGKSTCLRLAADYLTQQNLPVETAHLLSPECRSLPYFQRHVNDPTAVLRGEVDQLSLALVCLGDRLMNFRTIYHRKLMEGSWLLVDRYVFTALAEALALGTDGDDIDLLAEMSGMLPRPDAAFFPAVSPEKAIQRIRARPEEKGYRLSVEFHRRAAIAFHGICEQYDFVEVETGKGLPLAQEQIKAGLEPLLAEHREQYR